jgi:PKD repeat protein
MRRTFVLILPGDFMRAVSLRRRREQRTRGQSVVEFALVVPVLLLLTLTAIDFGRVFLGWVNLQQMTRIAANQAAEHASAWGTPGDATERAKYQQKVKNDARLINCTLPNPLPDPVINAGTELGAPVTVGLTCQFNLITPIIANVLGGTILVSAETTYPVKEGVVATVPGGGAPIVVPPVAKFVGSPQSGWSNLVVSFTNSSTGAPTSQTWNFNVAPSSTGTGSGSVSPANSLAVAPPNVTYTCTGAPGDTCTWGVTLQVGNAGGTHTETKLDYITVTVPPAPPDPIAEFTGTPRTGVEPQTVNFSFVDLRGGTVTYTLYEWDLDGNGSFEATGQNVSRTYPTDGVFDISLRVTATGGATNTLTKKAYIVITNQICTVPAFGTYKKNQAQALWTGAGFTTQVQFQAGQGNYNIGYQSLTGGTIDPQPAGCASVITVGPP